MPTKSKSAINKKTAKLTHEGKDPKQAYAIANSMARSNRLTKGGGYIRKKKAKKPTFGEMMHG